LIKLESGFHDEDKHDFFVIHVEDDFLFPFRPWVSVEDIPAGNDFDLRVYKGLTACQNVSWAAASESAGNAPEEVYVEGTAGKDDTGDYYIQVKAIETDASTSCPTYTLMVRPDF
jgi:hypothetical protein